MGSLSIRDLAACLFAIRATQLECAFSFLRRGYLSIARHLLSRPSPSTLAHMVEVQVVVLHKTLMPCAVFGGFTNREHTYHAPMWIVVCGPRKLWFKIWTSRDRCSTAIVMVLLVWLQFPIGPRVSVHTVVAVSVTFVIFQGGVVSPTPNPWPGGPVVLMDVLIILMFDLIFMIHIVLLYVVMT